MGDRCIGSCNICRSKIGRDCIDVTLSDRRGNRAVFPLSPFPWVFIILALNAIAVYLLPWLVGFEYAQAQMLPEIDSVYQLPLAWFLAVFCAPLTEEILVRGFIFKGIKHCPLGNAGAVLITATIWSVIHMPLNWYTAVAIFVFGLAMGLARWRTNSLYPTLVAHALFNFAASVALTIMFFS